jgi:hypothetical protein
MGFSGRGVSSAAVKGRSLRRSHQETRRGMSHPVGAAMASFFYPPTFQIVKNRPSLKKTSKDFDVSIYICPGIQTGRRYG